MMTMIKTAKLSSYHGNQLIIGISGSDKKERKNMNTTIILHRYFFITCIISLLVSCDNYPTSDRTQSGENLTVSWVINDVSSLPLRGIDGKVYWQSADNYIYAKKTAAAIEPPTDVWISDIPDDHGHSIRLSWTLSISENDGLVEWYRIYRSRSQTLTEPIPLNQLTSVDSLNFWDEHYTVLIDSVATGTNEYIDSVPLNGAQYYYWLQAVGTPKPSVTGTVQDQDGNPVEGALLRLYNADKSIDMNAISRSDGSYAFYDVPPGEYFLVAKRDDYQLFSAMVTVE